MLEMEKSIHTDNRISVERLETNGHQYADTEFYKILWVAKGLKSISADFETIPSLPNTIMFLAPGRIVELEFLHDHPEGWILSFSKAFFREQYLEGFNIRNIDVFYVSGKIPNIVLSPKIGVRVHALAEMISELIGSKIPNKELAISALLKTLIVYCDSNCNIKVTNDANINEINLVSMFKHHVSQHFLEIHSVSQYAEMMHITSKYLNQVVKRVMNVTAKSIIQEQIIIQACRDLKFSYTSVKEIGAKLGFLEAEHFSQFFKKETGSSPSSYRLK